jgi:hypothetical protein
MSRETYNSPGRSLADGARRYWIPARRPLINGGPSEQ